jgi:hypothetical protein
VVGHGAAIVAAHRFAPASRLRQRPAKVSCCG